MQINNINALYENNYRFSHFDYKYNQVETSDNQINIQQCQKDYTFKTNMNQPKLGVMLVGLGGNNGTTFTAGILANKHKITWNTKEGVQNPNWYGSITQCSTTKIGVNKNKEVFLPLNQLMPFINPDDIIISGWDISGLNMYESMVRAKVLDYDLQQKLKSYMENMVPLPSIYYPEYLNENQQERVDNVIKTNNKFEDKEQIRKDIQNFKKQHNLDKVVVLWTASTESFCKISDIHKNIEQLTEAMKRSHNDISPSTVFALASIEEGCSFINGSPQNTLVPAIQDYARQQKVFVVGDDFKSGQTKLKTSITDYFVNAGLKPKSIVSYNHLGNNDGANLSSEHTFKSKETTKQGCVDDILQSNTTLFKEDEHIDHTIVIKYVPSSGDHKKAIDEYVNTIFMNGENHIVIYNICEDSLLAAPIILDLILITEIFERIEYKIDQQEFKKFDSVLSQLGYLCKNPITPKDQPQINSLFRQKEALNNIFKATAGISLDNNLLLEYRAN